MSTTTDVMEQLRRDMAAEMKAVLGSGYVPDYYESMASGFVHIAERAIEQAKQS